MPNAVLAATEYYLPAQILSNAQLAAEFPEWDADKIGEKTGIQSRHIAEAGELSSDLAVGAAQRLFSSGRFRAEDIDFIMLCTQTPDFALPTTACLIQKRLGIPTTAGALDFNLGCSGYVYGLALAKGLIETSQAKRVLFLTAETYSKLMDPSDKSVRTIFGDAGAATVIVGRDDLGDESLGPFVFGTDGSGGPNLVCHVGGFRGKREEAAGHESLWMDGPEIFNFTLKVVPELVQRLLKRAALSQSDVDLFVFHQANKFMLNHLRKKMGIPSEKFVIAMEHSGNTVSCTIPIALSEAKDRGQLLSGMRVMLVGFGVGYSWGATMLRWV